MKLSKLMFRHTTLTISSIMVLILSPLLTSSVMGAELSGQERVPYQSSFEGYKPLSDENVADWKTLNEQSAAGGSMPGMSGNSDMSNMQGMDHSKMKGMNPAVANAKSGNSDMSSMEGMDHSKMQGMNMDNSNADTNSSDMSNMQGMDHSKMKGMSPSAPNTQPNKSDMSNMEGMDHSKMQGMSMDKSNEKSSKSDMSSMEGMKMDSSDAKSDSSGMSNMKNMDSAPANAKPVNSDMSSMQGMDHSKMQGANQNEAAKIQQFQILPNLHPIAVHFPIVLILIAFIFSLTAFTLRQHALAAHLAASGRFSLWLASISAVIAALLGWLVFNSVNHDDAGHAAMLLHRAWAIPTASGIVLLAAWDIWKNRATDIMSIPELILLFLLSTSIAVTGWLGGEVVYRHGIGVLSMPAMEATGNGKKHEHGTATVMPPTDSAAQTAPSKEGEFHEH